MLDKIKQLLLKGNFDAALTHIERSNHNELDVKILKSITLRQTENHVSALEVALDAFSESSSKGDKILELSSLTQVVYCYYLLGEKTKSEQGLSQFENMWESLSDDDKLTASEWLGYYYHIKTLFADDTGNPNLAMDYARKSIEIRKKLKYPLELVLSLNNLSSLLTWIGDYQKSYQINQEMITFSESFENQSDLALSFLRSGDYHIKTGNPEVAEEFYIKSLKIAEKINSYTLISWSIQSLGGIAYWAGDSNLAFEHLKHAYSIYENKKMETSQATGLLHLIIVTLDLNLVESSNKYLEKLEILVRDKPKGFKEFAMLAKGLILKTNPRSKDKIAAQQIFEELHNVDRSYIAFKATLNLIELLLDELKLYGNDEVLDQIVALTQNIYEQAQENNSFSNIVELLILKSKLSYLRQDVDLANKLLQQAHLIAEEHGLEKSKMDVIKEESKLEDQLLQAKDMIRSSQVLAKRLEKSEIIKYLTSMQKQIGFSQ